MECRSGWASTGLRCTAAGPRGWRVHGCLSRAQVLSRVREVFGVEVRLRQLFEEPTVRGLSRNIEAELRRGEGMTAPLTLVSGELDFQLDAIDYSAKNFVHADLDAETFRKMQEQRGETFEMLFLKELMKAMSPAAREDSMSSPYRSLALSRSTLKGV